MGHGSLKDPERFLGKSEHNEHQHLNNELGAARKVRDELRCYPWQAQGEMFCMTGGVYTCTVYI